MPDATPNSPPSAKDKKKKKSAADVQRELRDLTKGGPDKPPIDFPGISILHYAGDGKWEYEEDFWAFPVAQKAQAAYIDARGKHDPDHAIKMTRQHWPDEPEWARRPAQGPKAR